jgi:seryl-tRNA synthetase
MIDIQTLRKDPEAVAKRLATRGPGAFDLSRFQQLESTRKQLQTAVEQAQASKNRIAKDIGTAKGKGHGEGAADDGRIDESKHGLG